MFSDCLLVLLLLVLRVDDLLIVLFISLVYVVCHSCLIIWFKFVVELMVFCLYCV